MDGYCAYPSADCPSGTRYGPFAAQADACTFDCTEVSPDLPCAEDSTCPAVCERGDPELRVTWSRPPAGLEPRGLAAGLDGRLAVTGAIDGGPLLVLLRDDGTVVQDVTTLAPDTVGQAVAVGDDGTVWVALQSTDAAVRSRVSLARLDASGVVQGGVGFATLGEQRVAGLGIDDTDAVTVGGVLDGHAWLERRTPSDAPVFREIGSDDAFEIVDLAVTRGGRTALVGVGEGQDPTLGPRLRLVDPGGAIGLEVDLGPLGARTTPGAVAVGPSGTVIVGVGEGSPWVLSVDDGGERRWSVEPDGVEGLHDVVVDDQGWVTLIGTSSGEGGPAAWIEQRNAHGELRWQRRLPPEAGPAVAVAFDPEQHPLVLGVAPRGDALWIRRFRP